ncbi:MAG: Asp-tRNA(Asn)/Glu-tRNA(Gln) amidotransferase subunit GatC, partial [Candidatus Binatia bacterium]
MRISLEQVRHIAELARLELTPEEEALFAEQLSAILDYVDQLSTLDLEGVPPTRHALDDAPRFRDDRVTNEPQVDALLANAPDRSGGFLRV